MAAAQLKPSRPEPPALPAPASGVSRRALLAGACAAPVAGFASPFIPSAVEGHPVSDDAQQSFVVTNWDRTLKKYRKAEAALTAAAHTEDEALYDRLGRHGVYPERLQGSRRALQRLLLTPAPTIAALALKLDLALYEAAEEFLGPASAMKALKREAHRLGSS